jgi:hypothetical protein
MLRYDRGLDIVRSRALSGIILPGVVSRELCSTFSLPLSVVVMVQAKLSDLNMAEQNPQNINHSPQPVDEVLGQTSLSGGELHGGFWRVEGARLVFHRLIDIPGVSLSGSLNLVSSTAKLTIRGLGSGTLKLRARMLSGRLDGTKITIGLAP